VIQKQTVAFRRHVTVQVYRGPRNFGSCPVFTVIRHEFLKTGGRYEEAFTKVESSVETEDTVVLCIIATQLTNYLYLQWIVQHNGWACILVGDNDLHEVVCANHVQNSK
jgi:hypothetical protein